MEEYLVIMRLDLLTKEMQPSPEQMQQYMLMYQEWVNTISAQNKFVGGKGLSTEGKVIKFDQAVTDGPFAEVKESIAGFIIIKASSFDDALAMAKKCPILGGKGNSVEVRKVVSKHNP
ncbi:MAG: YciI family protein [Chryseolinea sp.]